MKSQVHHTVRYNITSESAGEVWTWSLLEVKGLIRALSCWYPQGDDVGNGQRCHESSARGQGGKQQRLAARAQHVGSGPTGAQAPTSGASWQHWARPYTW